MITSPQCPGGATGSVLQYPYGNPTGECYVDFTPLPGITYTVNSTHALEFKLDPVGTQCGQTGSAACFSDPLGYYKYPWPSIPTYTGAISPSEANVVNEPCSATGSCTSQNIPSLAGGVQAPEYWYLAHTSQPWKITCDDVTNGAVGVQASGPNICATFTPNYGLSLAQAEQVCGLQNFDWVQHITAFPDPVPMRFYARNLFGAFDPSIIGSFHVTSSRTPFNDPPPGGGWLYTAIPDNSYPFFWDPSGELATHENGTPEPACTLPVSQAGYTLTFHDAPGDTCLPGGLNVNTPYCSNSTAPSGSYMGFVTRLAGVKSDGSAKDLGIGFNWLTTYGGTTGGVEIAKTDLPADGNAPGGIAITAINETTHYDPSNANPPAIMLTGTQVSVTISRFVQPYWWLPYEYSGHLTITNQSSSSIAGPFQVLLDSLYPPYYVLLINETGTFGGWPYVTIPNLTTLNPGQSVNVNLQFYNLSPNYPIQFIPIIYSGSLD